MAAPEFLFAIELSGPLLPIAMIRDLACQVLVSAGCSSAEAAPLADALHAAVDRSAGAGHRSCKVQFHAHQGELNIDVTSDQGSIWHDTRRLA